ncbi:MAG: adenine deaminase [Bacillota bacterium]|nr:adenine deaminase [Bacillota bacterium]MDW7676387.1 adenine deaminase [Bacillota bacterium]
MKDQLRSRIRVASGKKKAALVLKNARVVNVFTSEIIEGDVAIQDGIIAGIGTYEGEQEMDLQGQYLAPGLIDAHMHLESAMVAPAEFARAVVPRGTTTIVADPHEIANVAGIQGIEYILKATENIPLQVYIMLPSCVPTTTFENAGAVLTASDLAPLYQHKRVLGLAELMDYPGVVDAEEFILDKIVGAGDRLIDGHGPNIKDKELMAYAASGIQTEHECSTVEEMVNRLRLGMYVLIREGSAARNLRDLVQAVTRENVRRCLFCTDDKHPEDLLTRGHIDNNLRLAVEEGIDPIAAISMATINTAECYGLKHLGAVAPGYQADLVVFDNLKDFKACKVFSRGKLVAVEGKPLFESAPQDSSMVTNSVNIPVITDQDLCLNLKTDIVNIIEVLPHTLVTRKTVRKVNFENGCFTYHKSLDIIKLAVIERHHATGNIGLGLVEGFGLKNGAIAITIGHDSHNLIVIGDNDRDMLAAIGEIKYVGGGITLCSGGNILATLPLPIAGLMSDRPLETVRESLEEMIQMAWKKLSISREIDPFMMLSFLSLPVIPEIKLTDMGLFDVQQFKFIDIQVQE